MTDNFTAHRSSPIDPALPVVDASGVVKIFTAKDGTSRPALDNVSLQVERGEFVVVVGPSGCGKTTMLRCVAGLEAADAGQIRISGKTVYSPAEGLFLPPEQRNLSMVFQSYALWPHMSVLDNVAYPLQCRRVGKAKAREQAARILSLLGLADRVDAYPAQLSGGQQQRIALARAMVAGTDLVLFDEPLSNLDAQVRDRIRSELGGLQREYGFSALYVTHDQSEAMGLADKLVVMNAGRIAQMGSPRDIYMRPRSAYVGNFLGRANIVPGNFGEAQDGGVSIDTPLGLLVGQRPDVALDGGSRASALIRPEHVQVVRGPRPELNVFEGEVISSRFLGGVTETEIRAGGLLLIVREPHDEPHVQGERILMRVAPERLTIVPDEEGAA